MQRNKKVWPIQGGEAINRNCPYGIPDIELTQLGILSETKELKDTISKELKGNYENVVLPNRVRSYKKGPNRKSGVKKYNN